MNVDNAAAHPARGAPTPPNAAGSAGDVAPVANKAPAASAAAPPTARTYAAAAAGAGTSSATRAASRNAPRKTPTAPSNPSVSYTNGAVGDSFLASLRAFRALNGDYLAKVLAAVLELVGDELDGACPTRPDVLLLGLRSADAVNKLANKSFVVDEFTHRVVPGPNPFGVDVKIVGLPFRVDALGVRDALEHVVGKVLDLNLDYLQAGDKRVFAGSATATIIPRGRPVSTFSFNGRTVRVFPVPKTSMAQPVQPMQPAQPDQPAQAPAPTVSAVSAVAPVCVSEPITQPTGQPTVTPAVEQRAAATSSSTKPAKPTKSGSTKGQASGKSTGNAEVAIPTGDARVSVNAQLPPTVSTPTPSRSISILNRNIAAKQSLDVRSSAAEDEMDVSEVDDSGQEAKRQRAERAGVAGIPGTSGVSGESAAGDGGVFSME